MRRLLRAGHHLLFCETLVVRSEYSRSILFRDIREFFILTARAAGGGGTFWRKEICTSEVFLSSFKRDANK